ncbi:hypothetical protein [Parafrankia sp. EUN1f]|uniref:hypothetical protein n=1 Tax=Parafrankia sp. EUN1f TaxID=102897 RepID=UPI0001C45FD5|nr:hypothetical protein [Parafrankia sp. EUN1f]EFC81347.1 hypothetical protein FrEUN1fDRAFT_5544 [Parafrankia sp. EUN1f]
MRTVREHVLLLVLLVAGTAVRLAAVTGYRPALWFNDSYEYVAGALRPEPYVVRPSGYSFFLRALEPFHSFELVVLLQHALGLAIGVAVYALLLRLGAPAWAAAIGAAPQLLDAYQIELEHLVLSETVFTALLMTAVLCLLWQRSISVPSAVVAGLALALAAVTRSVGLPLALAATIWLLARRPAWKSMAAFGLTLAVPVLAYCSWHRAEHGSFATSGSTGVFLYSRTATFADCAVMKPPAELRPLCPTEPTDQRNPPSDYIWHGDSPLAGIPGPIFDPAKEELARDFAVHAVLAQPLDYLDVVGRDFMRTFESRLEDYPSRSVAERYLFGSPTPSMTRKDREAADLRTYEHGEFATTAHEPTAGWLVTYQRHAALPAPALGLLLVLGLVGTVCGFLRVRPLAAPLLLLSGLATLTLLLPPATAGFDYRYVPPAFPFLGAAAVAGALCLVRLIRRGASVIAGTPAQPDEPARPEQPEQPELGEEPARPKEPAQADEPDDGGAQTNPIPSTGVSVS